MSPERRKGEGGEGVGRNQKRGTKSGRSKIMMGVHSDSDGVAIASLIVIVDASIDIGEDELQL